MNWLRLSQKAVRGFPYFVKELRVTVSNATPLFLARPRVVHIWRNGPCDGGCVMCHLGFTRGEAREELFRSPLTDSMIPSLLKQIQELGGRGTMVSYMCGEPLLNRALLGWIEHAKRLRLDFRFTTNGYHLDQETARQLVAQGLFNIGISIESLDPAINEQIRPYPNSTAKAVAAITMLLEERRRQNSALSLNIKCTLTDLNLESLLEIVRRYGLIEGVIVTPQMFEVIGDMPEETKKKLWIRDVRRIEAVVRELKSLRARGYHLNADDRALDNFVRLYAQDPLHRSTMFERKVTAEKEQHCSIGTDNLFISNGPVYLCPSFPQIGSVLENGATLKQMWHSDHAHRVRAQIKQCQTLCTLSCTRRTSLAHKIRTFLKM